MAKRRSLKERIDIIQTRQAQLKELEKQLRQRYSAQERKQRTHRLIQIGAECEAYAGEINDLDSLKEFFKSHADEIRQTQSKANEQVPYVSTDELVAELEEILGGDVFDEVGIKN